MVRRDGAAMTLGVQITVDVEVWPPDDGRWPHVPLPATADCREEIAAFLWGDCNGRQLGLPYQLEVLARHGLRATFFVDPMFSFALGLQPLRDAVNLIQSHGQRVELHLHPEWITDPRSPRVAPFKRADDRRLRRGGAVPPDLRGPRPSGRGRGRAANGVSRRELGRQSTRRCARCSGQASVTRRQPECQSPA